MRRSTSLLSASILALSLAACSAGPQPTSEEASAPGVDTTAENMAGGPGVSVTAAPGVAFTYAYSFRLPPTAIAATQETHAQACEKLGVSRCRITGMRYRLLGENNIEAMLAFKLDPTLARAFGKTGIDAVVAAKGKLVDAEITGTDAGAEVARLTTARARAADEMRRIDTQLARPGLSATERATLQAQRAELGRDAASADQGAAEQRESLASTPMTFNYGSGPAVRGFDASAPLTSALDTAAGSAQVTLAALLGALALFGPPGLVVALGWFLWRRFGRRFRSAPSAPATPPA